VRQGVIGFLARRHSLSRTRQWRGQGPGYDPEVWRQFAEEGWLEALVPECAGGAGLGAEVPAVIGDLFGAELVPEPFVALGVLPTRLLTLAAPSPGRDVLLEALVSGAARVALAWQEAPGQIDPTDPVATTLMRGRLKGRKRFVVGAVAADSLLVSAVDGEGRLVVVVVDAEAPGVKVEAVDQVDGAFAADIELDVSVADGDVLTIDADAFVRLLDEVRVALAAQLLGLARQALTVTLEYAKTRRQFGQPIGAFQVLQHRMVNLAMRIRLSEVLCDRAVALQDGDDGIRFARAAAAAKASAAETALAVTRDAVQIHGGIGYTDECDIGLYLATALRLAPWLGAPAVLRRRFSVLGALASQLDEAAPGPFRRQMRQWLAEHCPPEFRRPVDRLQGEEALAWHRLRYEHGLIAPGWPQEYGGMDLPVADQIVMLEELERHRVARTFDMGIAMLGPTLMRFGTEAQKACFIPRALSGEHIWCQGYSEPGAGSDLASLSTTAVRDGDDYVVTGQKIWTSNAHHATHCFLLVRTSSEGRKQEGISFLLVDLKTPGIRIRPIRNLAGQAEFSEVFYDEVRVPAANLVGEEGQGWSIAKSLLGFERLTIGSPGPARLAVDTYKRAARALGREADPLYCDELAALETDLEGLTCLFGSCVDAVAEGQVIDTDLSMLKIVASEVLQAATERLMALAVEFGAAGRVPTPDGDLDLRQLFMISRPASIYGGTSEVQRNILSRQWLNLPNH
jgi:alkylation response protein AidB-like acyl-CoA dehydrogenase